MGDILEKWERKVKGIEVWRQGGYGQFIITALVDGIHATGKAGRGVDGGGARVKDGTVGDGVWYQRGMWGRGGATDVERRYMRGAVGWSCYSVGGVGSKQATIG